VSVFDGVTYMLVLPSNHFRVDTPQFQGDHDSEAEQPEADVS
jgi:hypothetical protein